jgi:glycyl-tRNA synthetase
MPDVTLEKLTNLAKRRGFVFPSSELYGGIGAIYDFGPLGVLLKNNIKNEWWRRFVTERDDVVGIESAILTKREVLKASGHEEGFVDMLVECKICHERFRADQEISVAKDHKHDLTEPKQFHVMFKTHVGSTEDQGSLAYLRPETAQGMFTNFKTILETSRVKVPFGIAQIGKSFRNEITTGEWLFRLREFEIAEIEYFVKPGTDEQWFTKWLTAWEKFLTDLGISKKNLKRTEYPKNELAHYSKRTVDIFYNYPVGWKELAAVANRTDYDLLQHQKASGKDLSYFDETTGKKYLPFVIEPTLGIERAMFAFLADAYREYPGGRAKEGESGGAKEPEIVLHLHPRLAPVKVAVLPLVHKDGLDKIARDIFNDLKSLGPVQYDESGSIGRRYRRQDEIGTPWCITVDYDTKKDKKVTVRDRDTMKQARIKISELKSYLSEKLS